MRFDPNSELRILITGGYGFIASNFINEIFNRYPNMFIVNIDAMYYCANELHVNEAVRNSPNYKFVKGNINNSDLVDFILRTERINYVMHFAAQSHVQTSFENSLQFTTDNIVGTHTLLECCRKYGQIKKFVHVSTDEVYGDSMLGEDEIKKNEQSILCPTNPYAATKAGAELIAKSYFHSYKMPIVITRGNNVYGPNQHHEKLVPRFIKLLKNDKPVTIQGDGTCVRAMLYVTDVAAAFKLILEKGEIGEIYNIGSDDHHEYSVMDIAKILIEKIKKTADYDKWIEYIADRPYNDVRYYISNKKVKDLGWEIHVNFSDGLDMLLKHYEQK